MKFKDLVLLTVLLIQTVGFSQSQEFRNIEKEFVKSYEDLNIPNLQINYVATLNNISCHKDIQRQEKFFVNLGAKLDKIDVSKLSRNQRINYEILCYETKLNLERVTLEKKWKEVPLDDTKSIVTVPNGKHWYTYILKRWVDAEVLPEEMFSFGLKEIEKVKSNMERLQKASGLPKSEFKEYLNHKDFFFDNPEDIQQAFENIKKKVEVEVAKLFPYLQEIPEVKIARGTNANLSQVPAYYSDSTFFYNFFDEPFNKRQLGWFYVHEAIPGHHYQFMVNDLANRTDLQNLFWYPGFSEGWGAYVEHLGDVLGVYETVYDEYGKWEWDLVRSVRVCLDVGLNYYGWSDKEAMDFWKKHIKGQDDIGVREINRMRRWPAQVITYKYGANVFLELLEEFRKNPSFDFKRFHQELLRHGDVPISILKKDAVKWINDDKLGE